MDMIQLIHNEMIGSVNMLNVTSKDNFFQYLESVLNLQREVSICHHKVDNLATYLKNNIQALEAKGWLSNIDDHINENTNSGEAFDLARSLFEIALISGQQAGFIDVDGDGNPKKWNSDASSSAMIQKVVEVRHKLGVPGINFTYSRAVFGDIAQILGDQIPLKTERLQLMAEFTQNSAYQNFEAAILEQFANQTKVVLDVKFLELLAKSFPKNFQEDPYGHKACLTALFAADHLRSSGVDVELDIWAASDYYLPQTLETLGLIAMSEELKDDLSDGVLLDQDDLGVSALRAASILIVERLQELTGFSLDKLHAVLWAIPKDEEFMKALSTSDQQRKPLPHMMVRTMRF